MVTIFDTSMQGDVSGSSELFSFGDGSDVVYVDRTQATLRVMALPRDPVHGAASAVHAEVATSASNEANRNPSVPPSQYSILKMVSSDHLLAANGRHIVMWRLSSNQQTLNNVVEAPSKIPESAGFDPNPAGNAEIRAVSVDPVSGKMAVVSMYGSVVQLLDVNRGVEEVGLPDSTMAVDALYLRDGTLGVPLSTFRAGIGGELRGLLIVRPDGQRTTVDVPTFNVSVTDDQFVSIGSNGRVAFVSGDGSILESLSLNVGRHLVSPAGVAVLDSRLLVPLDGSVGEFSRQTGELLSVHMPTSPPDCRGSRPPPRDPSMTQAPQYGCVPSVRSVAADASGLHAWYIMGGTTESLNWIE